MDESSLYRIHKKGTKEEYKESYYYVLEAKLVLHPGIVVSIMTEFVENRDKGELEKQDCERKACWRLMKKLKKEFPRLPLCVCVDSLYTCERFFKECVEKGWKYILRFKEGSIPCVSEEYESLKKRETNSWKERVKEGWDKYDYVNGIDYNGNEVNVAEKEEKREKEIKKGKQKGKKRNVYKRFLFLSSLPLSKRNVAGVVEKGRNRWKIENEGFNTQKKHGFWREAFDLQEFLTTAEIRRQMAKICQVVIQDPKKMEACLAEIGEALGNREPESIVTVGDFKRILEEAQIPGHLQYDLLRRYDAGLCRYSPKAYQLQDPERSLETAKGKQRKKMRALLLQAAGFIRNVNGQESELVRQLLTAADLQG